MLLVHRLRRFSLFVARTYDCDHAFSNYSWYFGGSTFAFKLTWRSEHNCGVGFLKEEGHDLH